MTEKKGEKVVIVEEKGRSAPKKAEKGVEGYVVKQKPKLDDELIKYLRLRRRLKSKKPKFRRQEWFRYQRLGEKWRKPKGLHSKMRKKVKYRPAVVAIGYRGPSIVRGYHPSGFREVLVHNIRDLERIDPKAEAARIAASVGMRKRTELEKRAEELGIRVLNKKT